MSKIEKARTCYAMAAEWIEKADKADGEADRAKCLAIADRWELAGEQWMSKLR